MKVLPCRVCLKTGNSTIDMLATPLPTYGSVSLLEMFAEICEIAMQVGENSILCSSCQKRLIEAHKFRTEAQKAVTLLEKAQPEKTTAVKEETIEYLSMDDTFDDYELTDNVEALIKDEKPEIKKAEVKKEPRRKRSRPSSVPLPPATLNRFNCRFV